MRKLLGITGIRSDYDLLSGLYRRLASDLTLDFRLLVGGAHMSRTYGHSVDLIREDAIPILATVENLIDADSASARLKSASIMLEFAVDVVAQWNPELIIYAGDREEVWIGGVLGNYLGIPTVHFYGGDHTGSWHIDNPARHAASKLSSFHIVSTEEHRRRLLAMGESDSRIAVLGSLALDNFAETVAEADPQPPGLPRPIGDYALVLFHPDPSECDVAGSICKNILLELKAAGLGACIGYPNTDAANRNIIEVYEEFRNEPRFFLYRNLRRREFISLYKRARFIIGNSSSGIVEAASVPIPAVNVGLRQRGRAAGRNVLFVDADRQSIRKGIAAAQDPDFRQSILGMANPYGDGLSCAKAYNLIVNTDFSTLLAKVDDPLDLRAKERE
jgi:UDP-N-acetylglucosamine 2-epimerase (non-hydrolysing)/GDP/UDP-N,N'-diacetylbacillosamine 2-epimerase (hydrolysing)